MDKKRKPALEKLFVYGTLKDAEVQQYLFGDIPPPEEGVLEHYSVRINRDGYFFLLPAPGNQIEGLVLTLDPTQMARADQWEGAPSYRREKTGVLLSGTKTECWVYNGNFEDCGPANPEAIAQMDRRLVMEEIKKVLG